MQRVGVGEEQPTFASALRALPRGVILAYPAGWQWSSVQQPELRLPGHKLLEHAGGAVGGLVVDYQDFADFGLRSKRNDRAFDGGLFVAHGENRGYGVAGVHWHGRSVSASPGTPARYRPGLARNQREA